MHDKFSSDLVAPLPAAKTEQPQPVKVSAAVEVLELDEQPKPRPQQPEVIGKGTRRTDANGSQGYVDPQGRIVSTRPKIEPVKTKPAAPVQFDPYKKYPDTGESRAAFRVQNGRVQNLSSGKFEDGRVVQQWGQFGGPLVPGMTSPKV
jgi:hypothetical protein